MTELAADRILVAVTCRVLKLSRQPYYRWLADPITPSEVVKAYRANALFDAHKDDPEFGHRLLADEARDAGESMSDRTAWRIASENGWWSAFGKKRGRNGKKSGPPVHDDLCTITDEDGRTRHEFTAVGPNQLWLTDITKHKTAWIPAIVATRSCYEASSKAVRRSPGVSQSRDFRGRSFSSVATSRRRPTPCGARSLPLGKYCRRSGVVPESWTR